ncbi:tripartite tricarboxylate transporter substrate binding protein [Alcaligenaceae bacterium]|nr:tripartite tricarboxylate transporter substrate binding protein [Alcaligenaceae bacterium]
MFLNSLAARLRCSTGALGVVLMMTAPNSMAANTEVYPSKPITIIVPSAAGNVVDAVARLVGGELTKVWKQPVIVENKPGAGTTIGTRFVAKAPKDGYTVLLTYTAHVQNPLLYADIGYDPIKDFEAVSEVTLSSTILAVSPEFEAKSLPALVTLVKANPGKYAYGSYGVGSTGHILGELLKGEAKLDMEHIAYKGGAPLATDLVAGHVKFGLIAVGTALPLLQAGKLIPVAIAGNKRSAILPDVPTFLEMGYQGFEPDAWMGLLFPAGVPKDRVDALSREVARIVKEPAMAKRLNDLNVEPVGNTPEEFAKVLKDDYAKWTEVIQKIGLKAQ